MLSLCSPRYCPREVTRWVGLGQLLQNPQCKTIAVMVLPGAAGWARRDSDPGPRVTVLNRQGPKEIITLSKTKLFPRWKEGKSLTQRVQLSGKMLSHLLCVLECNLGGKIVRECDVEWKALDWYLGKWERVGLGPPLGLFLFPALWVPSHRLCRSALSLQRRRCGGGCWGELGPSVFLNPCKCLVVKSTRMLEFGSSLTGIFQDFSPASATFGVIV